MIGAAATSQPPPRSTFALCVYGPAGLSPQEFGRRREQKQKPIVEIHSGKKLKSLAFQEERCVGSGVEGDWEADDELMRGPSAPPKTLSIPRSAAALGAMSCRKRRSMASTSPAVACALITELKHLTLGCTRCVDIVSGPSRGGWGEGWEDGTHFERGCRGAPWR